MRTFEDFKALATNPLLTDYEKVGFSAVHRAEKEGNVFPDIRAKLQLDDLNAGERILDIGSGCSRPVRDLIAWAGDKHINVELVDSAEMLANLADAGHVKKTAGKYPDIHDRLNPPYARVIVYSLLPLIVFHQNHIEFFDRAVDLLSPGGILMIGDVSNLSKKRRFLATDFGRNFGGGFDTPNSTQPPVSVSEVDDALVFAFLARYRGRGCETYLLPQGAGLPLNFTREDVLVVRSRT